MKLALAWIVANLLVGHTSTAVIEVCDEPTLRAVVSAGGNIQFGCSGTITISNTLTIGTNCVLDGNGNTVVIDGTERVQVLHVLPGFEVTLRNLQISGGRGTNGAGIYNEGRLLLLNCTLVGNTAIGTTNVMTNGTPGRGGAIYNTGSLVVSNCIIATNSAIGGVGADGTNGVWSMDYWDQFNRCRSTPNTAGGPGYNGGGAEGGAIFNAGTTVVANTTFLLNRALGGAGGAGGWGGRGGCLAVWQPGGAAGTGGRGAGGAIHNQGSLTLEASALLHNEAYGGSGGRGGSTPFGGEAWHPAPGGLGGSGEGGGIFNSASSTAWNTTFDSNRAIGGDGGVGGVTWSFNGMCSSRSNGNGGTAVGGALANHGTIGLTNVTIWNHWASGGTATNHFPLPPDCPTIAGRRGIEAGSSIALVSGELILANSIVSNVSVTNNCAGTITDGGYNICSDASAAFMAEGSLNNTDPRLVALADNGGPTHTCALLSDSPAIDAGNNALCSATDQRGVLRPQRGRCDIGAYEASFLEIALEGPGTARFEFSWIPLESCRLQSSSDLLTWDSVETKAAGSDGRVEFTVMRSAAARFFRVSAP